MNCHNSSIVASILVFVLFSCRAPCVTCAQCPVQPSPWPTLPHSPQLLGIQQYSCPDPGEIYKTSLERLFLHNYHAPVQHVPKGIQAAGTGARLQRLVRSVLSGKSVSVGVLGGSNSVGHGDRSLGPHRPNGCVSHGLLMKACLTTSERRRARTAGCFPTGQPLLPLSWCLAFAVSERLL